MKVKIGIVEDERITAKHITGMLKECGYEVARPAMNYSQAIAMIDEEKPDLLLLDIQLLGDKDGIELAATIRASFNIPIVFLTANSDFETLSRAKVVKPTAFLTKPVTQNQLYAAIEIALTDTESKASATSAQQQVLFLNDGKRVVKVLRSDILYVESEENYIRIHTVDGKELLCRTTFTELIAALDEEKFVRVHRCYLVAVSAVTKLLTEEIIVEGRRLPVSKTYRPRLVEMFRSND